MNKQTNRKKIMAGRMNNDAKDCTASLELACVCIGIANSSSTGSSIIPAIECMMVVRATNCIRNPQCHREGGGGGGGVRGYTTPGPAAQRGPRDP